MKIFQKQLILNKLRSINKSVINKSNYNSLNERQLRIFERVVFLQPHNLHQFFPNQSTFIRSALKMFKKQQGIEYIDLKSKSGQQRKFFKVKYLGSGGFARCYQAYQQTNNTRQHYAFKIIKKSTLYQTKQLIQRLRTQIKLHKKFSQPQETANEHIVRFIESFQTQDYIYLLLELCVNQTLNELIRRRKFLTEEETRFYVWQLAHGLREIHERKVVHRDIKLCNLFLAQGLKMRIGDFGLATEIQQNRKRYTICGTANYIAPQMIQKDHNGGPIGHGYEVDVWALGVVCYTIFFGKYPFEAQEEQSIYNKVLSCKYSFNPYSMKEIKQLNINGLNHFPSNEFKSFIKGIFEVDPSKRFTLDEVLAHEFLNKTTVPKELPQISLKCVLKKDTIQKMFTKKQNPKQPQTTKNDSTKQKQQNQSIDASKIDLEQANSDTLPNSTTEFCIDQSNQQKQQSQLQKDIGLKKTQSSETQSEKTQKIQELPFEMIAKQLNQIESKQTSKQQSIFLQFQRKPKPQNEQEFSNPQYPSKIKMADFLLEIVLSSNSEQTSCLKKLIRNGMMIKVFNLSDRQGLNVENLQWEYTIIIHPKLNYLAKVIEGPKAKSNARAPLGEVSEELNNKQEINRNENSSKQKFVVKIPLIKSSLLREQKLMKGDKFDKDENKTCKKYEEEIDIVKMAYIQLRRMFPKGAQEGMSWKKFDQVVAN